MFRFNRFIILIGGLKNDYTFDCSYLINGIPLLAKEAAAQYTNVPQPHYFFLYSTVTDLARFLGLSTSSPFASDV